MTTDRAITTTATPATLRSIPGQLLARYVYVLSIGAVFRWSPNNTATDDGFSAIVPNVGGYQGAWLVCRPQSTASGLPTALANSAQHINIGLGLWFTAAAFTAPQSVTIDTTNAQTGDEIEILNPSAYVLTLVNGGPGAGTIRALPASAWIVAYFNGTDWVLRRSALLA